MQIKYRYANIRRVDSRLPSSFGGETPDWFSEAVSWLGDHKLLVFGAILLSMLLLAIACDKVLGSVGAGASEVSVANLTPINEPGAQAPITPQTGGDNGSGFAQLFGEGVDQKGWNMGWRESVGTLAFRLTLAAILGALVAFRPRVSVPLRNRNPYVVQTQILLTVVACALMIIVGDSTARAFGIFAAASLVRFRTNIRDPKETTILLVNLGVGLAAGVGRWELATMFALFVLLLLQILENYERRQAFSVMELSVRSHHVEATDEAVRELFRRNRLQVVVTELNKESEKRPLGKVVYSVDISPKLNTERLAEEIYSADPVNVDKIEWREKKTPSFAYGA